MVLHIFTYVIVILLQHTASTTFNAQQHYYQQFDRFTKKTKWRRNGKEWKGKERKGGKKENKTSAQIY